MTHTVRVDKSYSFLEVYINDLLHVRLIAKKLIGMIAQPSDGTWRIQFALAGGTTWTAYDDEDLWDSIVKALAVHYPMQDLGGVRVWISADKLLGLTTWGTRADNDWTIEWALEGDQYLKAKYLDRRSWHQALSDLISHEKK